MLQTALCNNHKKIDGKMVEFAGYEMPLFYKLGMVKEHLWVRESCGIFDVSHMGQIYIEGEKAAELLSSITPTDFTNSNIGQAKYSTILNKECGIIDDIIATKISNNKFFVVINASRKEIDIKWISEHLEQFSCTLTRLSNHSLIAIQGPQAEKIANKLFNNEASQVQYMNLKESSYKGTDIFISRCGYTGEDGFEISAPNNITSEIWENLLENDEVEAIGLGARDSLRLEVGYPLYGNDLSENLNVGEATMKWIINSPLSYNGKEKLISSPTKRRTSIKLIDKGIAREGMKIFNIKEEEIGSLSSAGFSPILNCGIGQAILPVEYAKAGSDIYIDIRGKLKKAKTNKLKIIE